MNHLTLIQLSEIEIRQLIRSEFQNVLNELGNQDQFSSEKDVILNVDQASSFLNLAIPTLYGLTSSNEIPHFKKGKKLYFKSSELLKWIESGRKKTQTQIDEGVNEYLNRKKKGGNNG